jgi:SAM-dependent methyltransferase
MTLDVMDSFTTDLPDSLVGKFDVVHVRAFTAVVKNNDPAPVIANAIKMLKPGGYLQWVRKSRVQTLC